MPTAPAWPDLTLRLLLAALAGIAVGCNREARSQAAGLRTTTLVCLAACISMVLANRLLLVHGEDPRGFVRMDVMRLPLGVLSGIGFIGAGAIIRRGDAVAGVTTAATLWYMTMVGLAFGAGELALGIAAAVAALLILWGLRHVDRAMPRHFRGVLTLQADAARLNEAELRGLLEPHQRIVTWAISYRDSGASYEARAELEWRGRYADRASAPEFFQQIARRPGVLEADWSPQAVSG
jgi:putative Mg2+ transporter-C (MgtC) family protein